MRATAISRHQSTELYLLSTGQEARDGATDSSLRLHKIADASVRCAAYEAHVEDVMPSIRFPRSILVRFDFPALFGTVGGSPPAIPRAPPAPAHSLADDTIQSPLTPSRERSLPLGPSPHLTLPQHGVSPGQMTYLQSQAVIGAEAGQRAAKRTTLSPVQYL